MDAISAISSQRALLEAFVPTSAALGCLSVPAEALANEFDAWGDEPVALRRTKKGRNDSAFRIDNAGQFFKSVESGLITEPSELLYRIGIVQQLALSSWLLDVGFTDDWCRRNIGLRIAKAFGYANASGLGFHDAGYNLLAAILTPYGKWRSPVSWKNHDAGPFSAAEMIAMTGGLLDHVQHVTGHTRRQ